MFLVVLTSEENSFRLKLYRYIMYVHYGLYSICKLLNVTLEHGSYKLKQKENSSNEYEIFENLEFKIC